MKKIVIFAAALAAAFTLASCNKEGKKGQPIEYETPVYSDIAVKFEIDKTIINDGLNGAKKYNSFEVTETGEYIIVDKDGTKTGIINNLDEIKGKEKGESKTFECKNFGKVELEVATKAEGDITLIFKPDGEVPISLTATPVETSETINKEFLKKICRKWKITDTTISASGGDLPSTLGVAKNFKGCDFSKIKDYLEDKSGKKINMGDISKYVVDYLQVTGCGTFNVVFTNGEAVAADLELITTDKNTATIDYEVSGEQPGIAIFNGKAKGVISFDEKGNCSIEVNANVDVNNDEYKGKVVFLVSKID